MAKNNAATNRLLRRFQRSQARDKRNVHTIPEREYFLLFCEGLKTEPNYFAGFADDLPKNVVNIIVDKEAGRNTISLVNYAIDSVPTYRREHPLIDFKVWIVFDKDSFPDKDFNNAITKAESKGFHVAYSNEAFELWYLLHFEFRNTAMSREDYRKRLTIHLGKDYDKSDLDMYKLLQSNAGSSEKLAVRYSKRLFQAAEGSAAQANPCTTVYQLVCELSKFRAASNSECDSQVQS